jgi:hypothetical protein
VPGVPYGIAATIGGKRRQRDGERSGAGEWRPARQEMVDRGAEGIEIAAGVDGPPLALHTQRHGPRPPDSDRVHDAPLHFAPLWPMARISSRRAQTAA